MSSQNRVPVGVDADAAKLLERAYSLDGAQASLALYRDWAETYDQTMLQGLGYLSPACVAELLAVHVPDRASTILDVGCGTGLAGHMLAQYGFTEMDGLDLSPQMMQVAQRRGVYRRFIAADLNQPLALASQSYDGLICSGTFTHAHVDASCLGELFRVLRTGGIFAFTVNLGVWALMGFDRALATLVKQGRARPIATVAGALYANSANPDGMFCVFARC